MRRISLNLVPHSRELFDNFMTDVIARRGQLGLFGFIAFILASSNLVHSLLENIRFEKYVHPEIVFVGSIVGVASSFALFLFLYRFSPSQTRSRSARLVAPGTATCLFSNFKMGFWYLSAIRSNDNRNIWRAQRCRVFLSLALLRLHDFYLWYRAGMDI